MIVGMCVNVSQSLNFFRKMYIPVSYHLSILSSMNKMSTVIGHRLINN